MTFQPGAWARWALLVGEVAWLAALLPLVPGLPDDYGVAVLVAGAMCGGGLLASLLLGRAAGLGVDRIGAGLAGALAGAGLAVVLGAGVWSVAMVPIWIAGVVLWMRGSWLAAMDMTHLAIGVSFGFGFVILAGVMSFGVIGDAGWAAAIIMAAGYFASLGLVTLAQGAERSGGQAGLRWFAVMTAIVAGGLAAASLALLLLGPFLREPVLTVLYFLLRILAVVIVSVMVLVVAVINWLTVLIVDLLQRFTPTLEDPPPIEAPAPDAFDPAAIISLLPPWVQLVVQVLLALVAVAVVAGIVAIAYRRRLAEQTTFDEGVRSRAEAIPASLNRAATPASMPREISDPLQQLGADGRWLRDRFGQLAELAGGATARQVRRAAEGDAGLAEVAPIATAFEQARYGLRLPGGAVMADLRRRWHDWRPARPA